MRYHLCNISKKTHRNFRATRQLVETTQKNPTANDTTTQAQADQTKAGLAAMRERIEKQANIERLERQLEEARRDQAQMR